jgi:hypothetical protein
MDENWPEFVQEEQRATRCRTTVVAQLTGWESVVFELRDDQDCGSDCSTAAMAP